MFKSTLSILTILITFSCKPQTAPLYNADPDLPKGTYYKDLDNDLDKFVGTWKWESGVDELLIVLEKKEYVHNNLFNKYDDMLIGEYKYVENGIEILNYLSRLGDSSVVGDQYYISGGVIIDKLSPPKCNDCIEGERRIELSFYDPETPRVRGRIILRYIVESGMEKLQMRLDTTGLRYNETTSPSNFRVPLGNYVLIKQD